MLLTTSTQVPELEVASTALTAVEPGDAVEVRLRFAASQQVELLELTWDNPLSLSPDASLTTISLPVTLQSGDDAEGVAVFTTPNGRHDFGLMTASLRLRRQDGTETTVTWEAWLSVFPREQATDPQGLSDEHRERLVTVVNARDRNGHIFVADFVSFFNDFLNLVVPAGTAGFLSQEFDLEDEELPVDGETYQLNLIGLMSIYGLTKVELLYEEECPETDEFVDLSAFREVKQEVI